MQKLTAREDWCDVAKAYGIILVYFGHILEKFYTQTGDQGIFLQYKLVYSFHMPFFFLLAGYFYKHQSNFFRFFKGKIKTRLVPVLFFCFLMLPFCLAYDGLTLHAIAYRSYAYRLMLMISGKPFLNNVMWFVICLFTVEFIAFYVFSVMNISLEKRALIIVCILAYIVGYIVNYLMLSHCVTIEDITGIKKNFWYIHEAVISFSFYCLGIFLKKSNCLKCGWHIGRKLSFLAICLVILFITFDLNDGPFGKYNLPAVSMAGGSHGHFIWFPVTACAGIFAMIFCAQVTIKNKFLLYVGRNTLILLGLSGFWHLFLNQEIVLYCLALNEKNSLIISFYFLVISVLSIFLCLPFVIFLNKYAPWVVGRKIL